MIIRQGAIFWIPVFDKTDDEIIHPHVIIQDDVINDSCIDTTVVCGLSTNMKKASEPGNILLDKGEADLPKQSIIVVSQIFNVKKTQVGAYIGTLRKERIDQLFDGMRLLQRMSEK
jgi:mRNA interferase MazF